MFRVLSAAALVSLAVVGCAPTSAEKQAEMPAARTVPLEIHTARGVLRYRVEVAATEAEQSRGLMYRTGLPPMGGMIFPMVPPRFASFWMKNTYIPLDLLFIRPNGTIERIAANAKPEDLSPIPSGEPVAAVLEIVGGGAAANGIAPGDKVIWQSR